MKTCSYCQSSIPDNDTRCPSCGSALVGANARPASPAQQARSRSIVIGIAIAGGLAIVGGAVGFLTLAGSKPSIQPPTPEPVAVASVPEKEAAPSAEGLPALPAPTSLADIKARGKLRIAADVQAPPFLSKKSDGTYEGFEYALMRTLADRAQVPLEVVSLSYDDLVPAVVDGKADLAVGQLARTRGAPVAWSVSYLQYSLCLIVPQKAQITYTSDLAGKRVGHYDDPAVVSAAAGLIGNYQPVLFSNYGYFDQLAAGQLDAVLYDCPLARHELRPYGDKLRIASDALNVFSYSIAVPAEQPVLLEEVNKLLVELGQQGLLDQLKQRWLGEVGVEAGGKFVNVRAGETIEDVARRVMGSPAHSADLYKANADIIGDDHGAIYGGMRLRLPQ